MRPRGILILRVCRDPVSVFRNIVSQSGDIRGAFTDGGIFINRVQIVPQASRIAVQHRIVPSQAFNRQLPASLEARWVKAHERLEIGLAGIDPIKMKIMKSVQFAQKTVFEMDRCPALTETIYDPAQTIFPVAFLPSHEVA